MTDTPTPPPNPFAEALAIGLAALGEAIKPHVRATQLAGVLEAAREDPAFRLEVISHLDAVPTGPEPGDRVERIVWKLERLFREEQIAPADAATMWAATGHRFDWQTDPPYIEEPGVRDLLGPNIRDMRVLATCRAVLEAFDRNTVHGLSDRQLETLHAVEFLAGVTEEAVAGRPEPEPERLNGAGIATGPGLRVLAGGVGSGPSSEVEKEEVDPTAWRWHDVDGDQIHVNDEVVLLEDIRTGGHLIASAGVEGKVTGLKPDGMIVVARLLSQGEAWGFPDGLMLRLVGEPINPGDDEDDADDGLTHVEDIYLQLHSAVESLNLVSGWAWRWWAGPQTCPFSESDLAYLSIANSLIRHVGRQVRPTSQTFMKQTDDTTRASVLADHAEAVRLATAAGRVAVTAWGAESATVLIDTEMAHPRIVDVVPTEDRPVPDGDLVIVPVRVLSTALQVLIQWPDFASPHATVDYLRWLKVPAGSDGMAAAGSLEAGGYPWAIGREELDEIVKDLTIIGSNCADAFLASRAHETADLLHRCLPTRRVTDNPQA